MKNRRVFQPSNGRKAALVYCRVSTDKQEDKGTSLESQEAACVERAEALGYKVEKVTKETYSGAEIFERPLLRRDREEIRAGQFDAVFIHAVDRISRKLSHIAIISEEIERGGAKLISVTDDLSDTPEGALMLSFKGYAAEIERDKIRERCVRGKRQKALNGKVLRGGTDLYGYLYDKERGVRVVNEGEARIIRQMFSWILEGLSTRKVIQRLNEQGIPSPGDGKRIFKDGRRPYWGKGVVGRILANPAYKGESIAWRFKGVSGFENGKKFNRVIERDESEWIPLPAGTTPEIVSPQIWDAVQRRLATNKGEETRNIARPDLLRGRVYCSECGRKALGQTEKGTLRVYRCSSRHTPSGHCGGKRLPADSAEQLVWSQIEAIIRNPKTISLALAKQQRDESNGPGQLRRELRSAEDALVKAEAEYQRLISRVASFEDEEVRQDIQRHVIQKKDERNRLIGVVDEARNRLTSFEADGSGLTSMKEYCRRVRKNLANFTFEDRRLALAAFGSKIAGNGREYLRLDVSIPDRGVVPQSCF